MFSEGLFQQLSSHDQATAILSGQYKMNKPWAQKFLAYVQNKRVPLNTVGLVLLHKQAKQLVG